MIGLIFSGAIILWILLTAVLANWLGNFLPPTPWRTAVKLILIPVVFFAPVADEVIAIPEMHALCEQKKVSIPGPDIQNKSAKGRIVRSKIGTEIIGLSTGIVVLAKRHDYIDVKSGGLVLSEYYEVRPIKSWMAYPDAGGSRNLWILEKCLLEPTNSINKKKFRQEKIGIQEVID